MVDKYDYTDSLSVVDVQLKRTPQRNTRPPKLQKQNHGREKARELIAVETGPESKESKQKTECPQNLAVNIIHFQWVFEPILAIRLVRMTQTRNPSHLVLQAYIFGIIYESCNWKIYSIAHLTQCNHTIF